jgi:hypothetical protein
MNLWRLVAAGLLAAAVASAQTVLDDPKKIEDARRLLDSFSGQSVQCDVSPIKPGFVFSLRLQAGYIGRVPLRQVQIDGQKWIVLARITPQQGSRSPVYLSDVVQFPRGGDNNQAAEIGGSFWLGEGRYAVKWMIFDGQGDACRREWQIDARVNVSERKVNPPMAPGTVAGLAGRATGPAAGPKPGAVGHLTILLHAASLLQKQTLLNALDKTMLLDAIVALTEETGARSVRLVVFNLEQQKEILRQDGFTIQALPEVSKALDSVQPGTVDYGTLQNPGGAAGLIEDLVNREIHAAEPSGAVVFLGPRSIYNGKPSPAFGLPPGAIQQYFYLMWTHPPRRPRSVPEVGFGAMGPGRWGVPSDPTTGVNYPTGVNFPPNFGPNNGPDSIQHAVAQLKGELLTVNSSEAFTSAVMEITRALAR